MDIMNLRDVFVVVLRQFILEMSLMSVMVAECVNVLNMNFIRNVRFNRYKKKRMVL